MTHQSLTFKEFSFANKDRCEHPEGFNHKLSAWSLSDWLTAAMGEFGEAANIAKKLNRVRDGVPGNVETTEELKEGLRRELADVFIYLDLLCQREGIDLGAAVIETFDRKSEQIGYPVRLEALPMSFTSQRWAD